MVVADEPTFGQDAVTWAELVGLLADLRDDGTAIVMVTHDDALVDAIADRTLSMIARILRTPTRRSLAHTEDRAGRP